MALVWRRSLSSGCMLLVARGSEKFAGLMAMKEEGEAFNTSNGFDGFQKMRHFPKVVKYSCHELGDNQVQERGKGSSEEEGRWSVKLL